MALQHFLKAMLVTFMVTVDYLQSDQSWSSDGLVLKNNPTSNHSPIEEKRYEILHKALVDSEMEEMADELQRQIDQLRKQMKDIVEKSQNSESEELVKYLQKQMADLEKEVQACYKKLDQLSSELQQEFRQKLDSLQREVAEANKKLEDRITDLENAFEKSLVAQCVGSLRDGMVHTAVGTFRQIKKPLVHIANITSLAYRDIKDCKIMLDFLYELRLDTRSSQQDKHQVRAIGYDTLYDKVSPHQFTPEGSDCIYKLAWYVGEFHRSVKNVDKKAWRILEDLFDRMPLTVSSFCWTKAFVGVRFHAPDDNVMFDDTAFYNEALTGLQFVSWAYKWTGQSSDGEWFTLSDKNDQPLMTKWNVYQWYSVLSDSKTGNNLRNPNALWKPVAVSSEGFYLKNKESGMYLAFTRASQGNRRDFNLLILSDFNGKTVFKLE